MNPETSTLIDELLAEQKRLTAVERFARRHEKHQIPAQARYYKDLIPFTKPNAGEQYAFEVDLDKCSGCKACVSACHSLNGLDEGESWRDVGLLFSEDSRRPFQQTITTACHHCAEPGCADGCPVLAYEKDSVTGIVRHLDDQCIGCQYCVMKCPYDVPKYSNRRGIVRKCDMCYNRLNVGEAPACVQACPHEAIRITVVNRAEVMRRSAVNTFLPTAPDANYTKPATRYVSARPLSENLVAGDHARVRPEPAHLPLVFMLVLTQLSVGATIAALMMDSAKWLMLVAAGAGMIGLNLAALHLGKPLKAWRAFLGWRKSWFSREVIAFSAFIPLTCAAATAFWVPGLQPFAFALNAVSALVGIVAVACSAMIYVDTHREFWETGTTFGKFFGTMALLGLITTLAVFQFEGTNNDSLNILAGCLLAVTVIKLGFEARIFRHLADEHTLALMPLSKTARLLGRDLSRAFRSRNVCAIIGGILLPLCLLQNPNALLAILSFVLLLCGELLERYLFFTAVAPRRMPGGIGV